MSRMRGRRYFMLDAFCPERVVVVFAVHRHVIVPQRMARPFGGLFLNLRHVAVDITRNHDALEA